MLRNVLLAIGCALLAFGVVAMALHYPGPYAGPPLVFGLVLTLGLIFERRAYKPILDALPSGDWSDTGERFIDPGTNRAVAVYSDPASGKRIYVGQPGRVSR